MPNTEPCRFCGEVKKKVIKSQITGAIICFDCVTEVDAVANGLKS